MRSPASPSGNVPPPSPPSSATSNHHPFHSSFRTQRFGTTESRSTDGTASAPSSGELIPWVETDLYEEEYADEYDEGEYREDEDGMDHLRHDAGSAGNNNNNRGNNRGGKKRGRNRSSSNNSRSRSMQPLEFTCDGCGELEGIQLLDADADGYASSRDLHCGSLDLDLSDGEQAEHPMAGHGIGRGRRGVAGKGGNSRGTGRGVVGRGRRMRRMTAGRPHSHAAYLEGFEEEGQFLRSPDHHREDNESCVKLCPRCAAAGCYPVCGPSSSHRHPSSSRSPPGATLWTRRRVVLTATATFLVLCLIVGVIFLVYPHNGGSSRGGAGGDQQGQSIDTGHPCSVPDYADAASQPWSLAAELQDSQSDYVLVSFDRLPTNGNGNGNGNGAKQQQIYRGFGTATALSADGTRLVISGRFGDLFHIFDRIARNADGSSVGSWNLVAVLPAVHEHTVDSVEELSVAKASVAISGDGTTIACGYPYFRTTNAQTRKREKWGAVVVYRLVRQGNVREWRRVGNEAFYGEGPGAYLGQALALSEDGTVLVLGQHRHAFRTGRVTVYEWDRMGEEWNSIGEIDGQTKGEQFGGMVAVSDDGRTLAASAMFSGDGAARVYRHRGGTTWVQLGENLRAVPEKGYQYFGWPVVLSGDGTRLAASSASFESEGDIKGRRDNGTVWIFDYDGRKKKWNQVGQEINGDAGGDGLGWGLALSSDGMVLAAGAPNSGFFAHEAGYVKIYRYMDSDWAQMGTVLHGEGVESRMGVSMSLSSDGKALAVSSPYDFQYDVGKGNGGIVQVFDSPFDFRCKK